MGLASAFSRKIYLIGQKHDLEFRIQALSLTQMQLTNCMNQLDDIIAGDLDPDSPEVKLLENRRQRLMQIEKKIETTMTRYQTQLKAIEAELESSQKMIDGNIKRIFSY